MFQEINSVVNYPIEQLPQQTNNYGDLRYEIVRLHSFDGYQSKYCKITDKLKEDFARSGCYWTRNKEIIKCAFCSFQIFYLSANENDPIKLHCRFNALCPLMSRRETKNVPIDPNVMDTFLPPKPVVYVENGFLHGKYPEYRDYEDRLRTYYNWTSTNVEKETLARNGFFSLDEGDRVACFYCGLGLENFEKGDNPRDEHIRYGACRYIKCQTE